MLRSDHGRCAVYRICVGNSTDNTVPPAHVGDNEPTLPPADVTGGEGEGSDTLYPSDAPGADANATDAGSFDGTASSVGGGGAAGNTTGGGEGSGSSAHDHDHDGDQGGGDEGGGHAQYNVTNDDIATGLTPGTRRATTTMTARAMSKVPTLLDWGSRWWGWKFPTKASSSASSASVPGPASLSVPAPEPVVVPGPAVAPVLSMAEPA